MSYLDYTCRQNGNGSHISRNWYLCFFFNPGMIREMYSSAESSRPLVVEGVFRPSCVTSRSYIGSYQHSFAIHVYWVCFVLGCLVVINCRYLEDSHYLTIFRKLSEHFLHPHWRAILRSRSSIAIAVIRMTKVASGWLGTTVCCRVANYPTFKKCWVSLFMEGFLATGCTFSRKPTHSERER